MTDSPIVSAAAAYSAPSSAWAVVAAPWRYALRPSRAARSLVAARLLQAGAAYALGLLVLGSSMALHYAANAAVNKRVGNTLLGTMDDVGAPPNADYSLRDALRDPSVRYHAAFVCVGVMLGISAAGLFMAWLLWPVVHVSGSAANSLGRSLRAVASGIGFLVLSTNLGLLVIHAWRLSGPHSVGDGEEFPIVFVLLGAFFGSFLLVLHWLKKAHYSLRDAGPAEPAPELCEGCGYDLSYRSPSGVCTECGLAIDESLTPKRRTDRFWKSGDGIFAALRWTLKSLGRGPAVYQRLAVGQADKDALRFRSLHGRRIGMGAGLWFSTVLLVMLWQEEPMPTWWMLPLVCAAGLFVGTLAALTGWYLHRAVGAVVSTYWFAYGLFPRPRYAETVINCEAGFLWVFCLFNGTLITSYMVFQDWITQWLGWRFWNVLTGAPSEPAFLFLGNAALILWWLVRLHRAFVAVRWANY